MLNDYSNYNYFSPGIDPAVTDSRVEPTHKFVTTKDHHENTCHDTQDSSDLEDIVVHSNIFDWLWFISLL